MRVKRCFLGFLQASLQKINFYTGIFNDFAQILSNLLMLLKVFRTLISQNALQWLLF